MFELIRDYFVWDEFGKKRICMDVGGVIGARYLHVFRVLEEGRGEKRWEEDANRMDVEPAIHMV